MIVQAPVQGFIPRPDDDPGEKLKSIDKQTADTKAIGKEELDR